MWPWICHIMHISAFLFPYIFHKFVRWWVSILLGDGSTCVSLHLSGTQFAGRGLWLAATVHPSPRFIILSWREETGTALLSGPWISLWDLECCTHHLESPCQLSSMCKWPVTFPLTYLPFSHCCKWLQEEPTLRNSQKQNKRLNRMVALVKASVTVKYKYFGMQQGFQFLCIIRASALLPTVQEIMRRINIHECNQSPQH